MEIATCICFNQRKTVCSESLASHGDRVGARNKRSAALSNLGFLSARRCRRSKTKGHPLLIANRARPGTIASQLFSSLAKFSKF